MKKILVCYFGVISRGIKYTHKSIEKNIINVLKQKYEVDTYVFNLDVQNTPIDNTIVNYNDKDLIKYNFYEEEKQCNFDKYYFNNIYKISDDVFSYYKLYRNKYTTLNAFRQLYTEYCVGLFVENNKNNYDVIVVLNADYFFVNNILLEQIDDCLNNHNKIYLSHSHEGNNWITNGFYFGNPIPIIKMLKRFHKILVNKLFKCESYEFYCKYIIDIENIERGMAYTYFIKIRANKTLFFNFGDGNRILYDNICDQDLEKIKYTFKELTTNFDKFIQNYNE